MSGVSKENAKAIFSDDSKEVPGGARLRPTTDPNVWEMSHFATSVRTSSEGRALSLSQSTLDSLDHVLEFAQRHHISRLIFVTSVGIERLMLRAGARAHRISAPALKNGNLSVALFIEVEEETAAMCRSAA